jgi:glycyl-tRNA synthetase alpha subunit
MSMGLDSVSDDKDAEMEKHMHFIESIAKEMQQSVQEIMPLYEEVLEALSARAHIENYLPIFVAKRVKWILRMHHLSARQDLPV